jgi:hypothetical protein
MKTCIQRLILFASLLLVPFLSNAQGNMEDVVYLKNGSIIRGIIIEQVPNVSLKLKTSDGNLFVFRIEEVEKITKEQTAAKTRGRDAEPSPAPSFGDGEIKQKGYSMIAEICPSIGIDDMDGKTSIGLQVINGYQINPHLNIGAGLGLHKHFGGNTYAPIFLDLRIAFMPKRVSPFLDLAGGWALGLVDEKESGVYLNPSFGVRFFVSRNTALQMSLGYRYQETSVTYQGWDPYGYYNIKEETDNLNAITLKFGVNL